MRLVGNSYLTGVLLFNMFLMRGTNNGRWYRPLEQRLYKYRQLFMLNGPVNVMIQKPS